MNSNVRSVPTITAPRFATLRPWGLLLSALLLPALALAQSVYPDPADPKSGALAFSTVAGNSNTGWADGTGIAAGFNRPLAIVGDAAGNSYVADTGNNTIRMITPDGTVTTIAGAAGVAGTDDGIGGAARFWNPAGIARDAAGNLYVADTGNHTVRKISLSRQVVTLAGTAGVPGFRDGPGTGTLGALFHWPTGLTVAADGTVYVSDKGNNVIRKITTAGVVTTLSGVGMGPSADYVNANGPLARFNGPRNVAVDSAGNVFVVDTNNQVIRRITKTGDVTLFAGVPGTRGHTDGAGTVALFTDPFDVVIDSSGNLYVSDYGSDTIRKITSAGVVSTLAGLALNSGAIDSTGSAARFSSPAGLAIDSSGNLYVADYGNSAIRKVTSAGVVTTIAGIAGSPGYLDATGIKAQFTFPIALVVDSSGTLFVADYGNQVIRKITSDGVVTTLAGYPAAFGTADGTGSTARFNYPSALALSGSGDLYVGDSGNATIRKVTSAGVVTTFAGTVGKRGIADGTGTAASFTSISGLRFDSSGNLFVAEVGQNTIREVTSAAVVTTFAGSPGNEGFVDGTSDKAQFIAPSGIVFDKDGQLCVSDSGNGAIRRVDPATGSVITLAGSGADRSNTARDGLGLIARFADPNGLAADGSGNLYVTDSTNSTIRKIVPAGVDGSGKSQWSVSTWLGIAHQRGMVDAVAGGSGLFNGPFGICIDSNGNLLIADSFNNAVRRAEAGTSAHAGAITTLAGGGLFNSVGSGDGPLAAARFNEPNALTIDPDGNIFVVDTRNCTIRKVTPDGNVKTIAGAVNTDNPGLGSHVDGDGSVARFISPTGIVRDSQGNLFVADTADFVIRKITVTKATGTTPETYDVQTFAGTSLTQGAGDGSNASGGVAATFYWPQAIAVDSADNLYVADPGNHTIRKITSAGVVTTVAGSSGNYGWNDAIGATAVFHGPQGIAVGPDNTIYVADTGNRVIRKIATDGTVTTIAGSILNAGSKDGVGTDAWFESPTSIAIDADGNLFVVDNGSNLVRKIVFKQSDSTYIVTTVGGVADKVGGADGIGSAVLFNAPAGIATWSNGTQRAVYVADTFNNTIRKGVPVSGNGPQGGGVYAFSGTSSLALRNDQVSNSRGQSIAVVAPSITAQPAALTVSAGNTVNFVVGVSGSTPLTYQWRKNGINLIGATSATLAVANIQPSDAGSYSAVVSNLAGTATSTGAVLTVNGGSTTTDGGRLINLSSRTDVLTGSNITISGFVVKGASHKRLLIRGIGPALGSMGVAGTMATPTMTLYAGSAVLTTNDGWKQTDPDAIRAAALRLGAFALPEDGRDCAILADFAEGIYTVHLQDKNGGSGVGLIELYDADTASGTKLVNLSTRAFVGRDANILITGLVISGPNPKKMLVRAVGPGLVALGVDGVLSHPQMVLYSGQTVIGSNAGWSTATNRADIAAVGAKVGAFALDNNSTDSAMLLTLEPGIYTIHVSGVNGETGTALVESYEVE